MPKRKANSLPAQVKAVRCARLQTQRPLGRPMVVPTTSKFPEPDQGPAMMAQEPQPAGSADPVPVLEHPQPGDTGASGHQDNRWETKALDGLWDLGRTPINVNNLKQALEKYPNQSDSNFLLNGFQNGFKLHYSGPRIPVRFPNLSSVKHDQTLLKVKLHEYRNLGRIIGPFSSPPMPNLRINPVGLVPKRTGGYRMITNLSFPAGISVNDYTDPEYKHVTYSPFDNVVNMVQEIGKCAFMAKADISSAFNLCPIWPGDFDLLGIKSDEGYWVQKTLPMGASCSCFTFEKFSTFIEWLVKKESTSENYDHLLDDFIMMHNSFDNCQFLMLNFAKVCAHLNVPLSEEKWEGPVQIITYLGLEIDALKQMIRVPRDKIDKAKKVLLSLIESKKVTLLQLQALTGLLNFLSKALPAGRAFTRRFYDRMSQVKKSFHFIRVTKEMRDDAHVWLQFLEEFNGTRIFNESEWSGNDVLELYTDAAGNKLLGCGCYFSGSWAVFKWPQHWEETVFADITYLELVPILLAFHIWGQFLENKMIVLRTDNAALANILNKKSSKNKNVMVLIRSLVLITLKKNIQIKAKHIHGKSNEICDAISRFQWQRLNRLLPDYVSRTPSPIPESFLQTLHLK